MKAPLTPSLLLSIVLALGLGAIAAAAQPEAPVKHRMLTFGNSMSNSQILGVMGAVIR